MSGGYGGNGIAITTLFWIEMICSSVNRFFLEFSLPVKGRELTIGIATRFVSGRPDLGCVATESGGRRQKNCKWSGRTTSWPYRV